MVVNDLGWCQRLVRLLKNIGLLSKLDALASKAGGFILETVIGAPARQLISFGLDVAKGTLELAGKKAPEEYVPKGISKLLLGEEPIKPKSTEIQEAMKEGKGTFGIKGPAGLGVLAGLSLLDVSPLGGPGKKVVKKTVEKLLKKI